MEVGIYKNSRMRCPIPETRLALLDGSGLLLDSTLDIDLATMLFFVVVAELFPTSLSLHKNITVISGDHTRRDDGSYGNCVASTHQTAWPFNLTLGLLRDC